MERVGVSAGVVMIAYLVSTGGGTNSMASGLLASIIAEAWTKRLIGFRQRNEGAGGPP
jgi:hypothetical protein